jgi:hypothetical protein
VRIIHVLEAGCTTTAKQGQGEILRVSLDHAKARYCFRRDGSIHPSFGLVQSLWACNRDGASIERSLSERCSEGFEYLEVSVRTNRDKDTDTLLRRFPLRLIAQASATSRKQIPYCFTRARDLGAVALNLHLGHAYMSGQDAAELIEEAGRQSKKCEVPFLIETHRGTLTQDLFRTAQIVTSVPDIAITLDISHFIVAGEILGGSKDLFLTHIEPLLGCTALIHGRISNGQCIQVSTREGSAYLDVLQILWQQAMTHWLRQAPANGQFLFEPELGPPPYAHIDTQGREYFDRETESRALVTLARNAWDSACSSIDALNGD